MATTNAKKSKRKPGPAPIGLGPPFTMRLFLDQHEAVEKDAKKTRVSKGEILRRRLG